MILAALALYVLAAQQVSGAPAGDESAAGFRLRTANQIAAAGIARAVAGAPVQGVLDPRLLSMPALEAFYPRASLRAEEEGLVRLQCTLGIDGALRECRIERSSGFPRLDAAAFEVARYARYSPRIVDRSPEPSEVLLPVQWVLE